MVAPVSLPDLLWKPSPNRSSRHGHTIDLLVWHETAGFYRSDVALLRNPASQASAHLVVREDGLEASQLVPIAEKAWTQEAFNSRAIGIEHSNITHKGYSTEMQLRVSARIFGWFCLTEGVPPRWARNGQGRGVCYHGELGAAGGGHTSCGPDRSGWLRFLEYLHHEVNRGHYRKTWTR